MTASNQGGIIVTQAGVDVRYAADYQMAFNSNWPSLQIVFDQTLDSNTSQISHNLGFYPFAIAEFVRNGVVVGTSFASNNPGSPGLGFMPTLNIGKSGFYLSQAGYTVNIKAYNIDLTKPADYTLPKPPVVPSKYDPSYGIKVSKYGKSIYSNDLRNFILHSRAQSPALLSVVTDQTGVPTNDGLGAYKISYTNPANYVPWIFGFSNNTTSGFESLVYTPTDFAYQSDLGLAINGSTTTNTYLPPNGATLVVLRDPLVVSKKVEADFLTTYNPMIGDFETPSIGTYQYAPAGSGWSYSSSAGIAHNGSAFNNPNAPSGVQCAFLQGPTAVISQTYNFTKAGWYGISLQGAIRTTNTQTVSAQLDGVQFATYTPATNSSWTSYGLQQFYATQGLHVISFSGTVAGDNTAFLDAISIMGGTGV